MDNFRIYEVYNQNEYSFADTSFSFGIGKKKIHTSSDDLEIHPPPSVNPSPPSSPSIPETARKSDLYRTPTKSDNPKYNRESSRGPTHHSATDTTTATSPTNSHHYSLAPRITQIAMTHTMTQHRLAPPPNCQSNRS